jgi:hypothetical protein
MKAAGRTPRTSRSTARRRGKPEGDQVPQDHPALQLAFLSTSRAAQRPSVLIFGSCHGKVFVADDLLVYAETLDGEEAVRAWLVQHDIQLGPSAVGGQRSQRADPVTAAD